MRSPNTTRPRSGSSRPAASSRWPRSPSRSEPSRLPPNRGRPARSAGSSPPRLSVNLQWWSRRRLSQTSPPPKGPEIRFGRTIRLTLKGIRDKPEAEVLTTIGTILDAVRDAGGTVGPVAGDPQASFGFRKATCRFVLDDLPELRKKATEAALAQARADAGVLSGGRVGPLVSISSADSAANLGPRVDTTVQAPLDTDRFTDIPVRVTVQATFRLE